MKLIVNPHKVEIDKEEAINEKEINVSLCKFEFADEITDNYVKEAYFTYGGETYKQIIVDNMCTFPQEVLQKEGTVELGVVATYTDLISGEITRYNPSPVYFKTDLGSLREAQNSQPITPSEMEQYEQALQDGLTEVNSKLDAIDDALDEVDNLDIDANKVDNITTVTITDKLGDTKTVQILDGINGIDGKDGKDGVDGKDGKDGIDGTNGVDGFSPVANVSKSNGTATITITDKNGTTTATVSDGINGTNGRDGVDGQDGRDGYVQYTAGNNITIENNVISATSSNNPYAIPLYYFPISETYDTTQIISFASDQFISSELQLLNNIINDAYSKGFVGIALYMHQTLISNDSQGEIPLLTSSPKNLQTKPTSIWLRGNKLVANKYTPSGFRFFASTLLKIDGTWSNDVFTITQAKFGNEVYDMLTLDNTRSYTPTSNYHPATKKYVDDSIASVPNIQYSTMPTASSETVDKIIQYVGTTTNDYTKGYFYIGTTTTTNNTTTYGWSPINTEQNEIKIITDTNVYINDLPYGIYIVGAGSTTVKIYGVNSTSYTQFKGYGILFVVQHPTSGKYGFLFDRNMMYSIGSGNKTTTVNFLRIAQFDNTTEYTPLYDYNPAHKKYVDDSIASAITDALGGSY